MLFYNILTSGKDKLTFLGKTEENIEIIMQTISEFKKHCLSLDTLKKVIERINNEKLSLKLQDIYYCYQNFQEQMGDTYIEENDILGLFPEKVKSSRMFQNASVFIDEFSGFTLQEYAAIEAIMKQADEVIVTIASDNIENTSKENLFYTNNIMAQKLIEIAKKNHITIEKPVYLEKAYRFKNEELSLLEKNLYDFPEEQQIEQPKHIHLGLTSNPYTEVEKVARQITTLTREKGYYYRDIAVITKNTEEYVALIKAIFRSYDIPNFIDEKKELSQNILIRYILSVLEILSKGWRLEDVLSALKTGFFPITREDEQELENYVIRWGIKGKAWYEKDWKYGLETEEEQKRINQIRKKVVEPIVKLKEDLGRSKTIRIVSQKLYEYLKETNVEEAVKQKVNSLILTGEIEIAKEYISSLEMVIKVLDDMVDIIGNEQISFEKQLAILKIGFSGNVLGAIPATLDQVIVGDVERSRSHKVKAVFILGINDGIFPSNQKEEGFLNDIDRKSLKEMGIELAKDSMENLYEEQFSIYKAFTIAEEELYLSYPSTDKQGSALRPSRFIKKVKKIFPNLIEQSDVIKQPLEIVNKRVTFDNLLIAMQSGEMNETWQTVLELYKKDNQWNGRLQAALKGREDTNLPSKINEENIKKLYGNVLKTSVSKLEQYRKCPFSFHLKYGLKLKEPPEFAIKSIDTGSFMHEAIARFFELIEENNLDYKQLEDSSIKQLVQNVLQEQLSLSKNGLFNSTPKFQSLTRRLGNVIAKAIKHIIEQLKFSDFRIAGTEIEFSKESSYEPMRFTLDTGEEIELTGKIDRIDIAKDSSGKYLRIIDYKSSVKNIDFDEVLAGVQIQLLTYLDAAMQIEQALPAGVFYFSLIDNVLKAKRNKTDEEIEKELKKQFKLNGILLADIHVVRMMDKKLEKGYSDIIPVFLDKNGQLSLNKSNVLTLEQFNDLQKNTKNIIKQLSKEILSGNIEMKPYRNKSKQTACEYCPYKNICHFSPNKKGNEYFTIKPLEKKLINNHSNV